MTASIRWTTVTLKRIPTWAYSAGVAMAILISGSVFFQSYAMVRIEHVRPYVESVDAQSVNCRERMKAYWTGRTWNEKIVFFQKFSEDPLYGWLVRNDWTDVHFISEVSWRSAKFDCER